MSPESSLDVRPCVLVPVFDNHRTVGEVVAGARALGFSVLVVDDGSRDGSGERALDAGGEVVRHEENKGKGAALKTGFRAAFSRGFTHAVSIDADGQHFPEDIPRLVAAARASPDALVVGAREWAAERHVQGKSAFGRSFSNFWVWFETGVRVADSQCGLRVYPLAHVTRLGLRRDRFDLEVEVIVRAAWAGLPVLSVPVRVHYPPPDERVSHFDLFHDNVRISLLNTALVARRLVPWPHRKLVR
jgi:glycosyltransferase involved in cell wall biosynthesis